MPTAERDGVALDKRVSRCNIATVPFEPDLRSSKMESSEGRGIARSRWLNWWRQLPQDLREALGDDVGHSRVTVGPGDLPLDTGPWAKMATEAREQSELIGFWIAWHQAGGFQALELSGWNRATIYRKLRRFRTVFGAHPDEYDFDWITLDLTRSWFDDLGVELSEPASKPVPKRRK